MSILKEKIKNNFRKTFFFKKSIFFEKLKEQNVLEIFFFYNESLNCQFISEILHFILYLCTSTCVDPDTQH